MKPIAIHQTKRFQAVGGNFHIRYPQVAIAARGTNGTQGVLKGRGCPGAVRRRTRMPAATRIKANNVPMLHTSAISSILATAEMAATKTPVRMVGMWGVRKRG